MHQAMDRSGFGTGPALTAKEMRKEQVSPCSLPRVGLPVWVNRYNSKDLDRNYALVK